MKKTVLLLLAITAGTFGTLAQTASAESSSIMCKLEQMGVYHSPIGSACHENPWEE